MDLSDCWSVWIFPYHLMTSKVKLAERGRNLLVSRQMWAEVVRTEHHRAFCAMEVFGDSRINWKSSIENSNFWSLSQCVVWLFEKGFPIWSIEDKFPIVPVQVPHSKHPQQIMLEAMMLPVALNWVASWWIMVGEIPQQQLNVYSLNEDWNPCNCVKCLLDTPEHINVVSLLVYQLLVGLCQVSHSLHTHFCHHPQTSTQQVNQIILHLILQTDTFPKNPSPINQKFRRNSNYEVTFGKFSSHKLRSILKRIVKSWVKLCFCTDGSLREGKSWNSS